MNRRVTKKVLLGVGALPFLFIGVGACSWTAILCVCQNEMAAASVDGPAPVGSFEIRRSWGEKNLHHHFARVEKWIRQSKEIEADIGKVVGIAPIGSPNRYTEGLGESWARMNLQVVGENGEGILYLPDVCADDPDKLFGVKVNDESWKYSTSR